MTPGRVDVDPRGLRRVRSSRRRKDQHGGTEDERRTNGEDTLTKIASQRGSTASLAEPLFSVRLRCSVAPCEPIPSVISVRDRNQEGKPMVRTITAATMVVAALGGAVTAADWPQWRGPHGSGVADESNLPDRWTASENVVWKAALAGAGVSSPIVSGDRVFVTSQVGAGVRRPGSHPRLAQGASAASAGERALASSREERTVFVVEAFARGDGRRLWEFRTDAIGTLPGVHDKHNLASPSPVTDGQMVY